MRIGEIAEKTGVSRDTIRLYENMGLLKGISRPNAYNNYKDYPEENIERVQFVLLLKKLGLSLKECQELIATIENNNYNRTFQKNFIDEKIRTIDAKIEKLKQLRQTLKTYANDGCDNEHIIRQIKGQES